MATCLIALGGNLGDRAANLNAALRKISATGGITDVVVSDFLETVAVGGPAGQPGFLNAAAKLESRLSPLELARRLRDIETQLGRAREVRWDARTVDLDLLLYDDAVCRTQELELPHPRMTVRQFVMRPAEEVADDMRHPGTRWTIGQHAQHLRESPREVVLVGGSEALRTDVAAAVNDLTNGESGTQWAIAPSWNVGEFLDQGASDRSLPRVIVVLQGQRQVPDQDATAATHIKQDQAADLAQLVGGAILRVSAQDTLGDIAEQVVAAMQASDRQP